MSWAVRDRKQDERAAMPVCGWGYGEAKHGGKVSGRIGTLGVLFE